MVRLRNWTDEVRTIGRGMRIMSIAIALACAMVGLVLLFPIGTLVVTFIAIVLGLSWVIGDRT